MREVGEAGAVASVAALTVALRVKVLMVDLHIPGVRIEALNNHVHGPDEGDVAFCHAAGVLLEFRAEVWHVIAAHPIRLLLKQRFNPRALHAFLNARKAILVAYTTLSMVRPEVRIARKR